MPGGLDSKRLGLVFESRPDILEGIKAAADSPARVKLFNNIATFLHDQLQSSSEPANKKRRLDDGSSIGADSGSNGISSSKGDASQEPVLLEVKEISVSIPQRKKYDLCFTPNHLYARAPGTSGPAQGIVYPWANIEYAFYLPVPEKSQVQHNYVLFPKGTCLSSLKGGATSSDEPLVFTVPATAPKEGTIGGAKAGAASSVSDSYQSLFHWALKTHLKAAGNTNVSIVSADPNKFHSVIKQSHRPKEKAVHVKAFRGSKDGYLFFLDSGILWGYKKPMMFIPIHRIAAISYTNVLLRTFNMVVEVFTGEGDETEEIEFGMMDQVDYGGISETYVKRHGLQDRSMADTRKAKMELAENLKKKVKTEGGDGADELAGDGEAADGGLSELAKAQLEAEQQLQDEEDEDEEDYDPGSDEDSGGSGSSSEDDDDDEDDDDEEGGDEEDGEGEEERGEDEGEEAEQEGEAEEEEEEADVGVPYTGAQDDEMDMDEKFDVVG